MKLFKRLLIGLLLNAIGMYVVMTFVPGIDAHGDLRLYMLAGIVVGLLNLVIKPLMKLLALPIVFLTMGLFMIVINVIIFWLTVKAVNVINLSGVSIIVKENLAYLYSAIVLAVTNWLLHILIKNK